MKRPPLTSPALRPVKRVPVAASAVKPDTRPMATQASIPQMSLADMAIHPPAERGGLPGDLRNGIERLSGLSMAGVKVHYDSAQPRLHDALAYTQGRDIHLGPGQERHLPHEAWHVVQQARRRVRPTTHTPTGAPLNDDAGLEREADLMGARAQLRRLHRRAVTDAVVVPDVSVQRMKNQHKRDKLPDPTPAQEAAVRAAGIANSDGLRNHGRQAHGRRTEAPAARVVAQAAADRAAAGERAIQLRGTPHAAPAGTVPVQRVKRRKQDRKIRWRDRHLLGAGVVGGLSMAAIGALLALPTLGIAAGIGVLGIAGGIVAARQRPRTIAPYNQATDPSLQPYIRPGQNFIGEDAMTGQIAGMNVTAANVRVPAIRRPQQRGGTGLDEGVPTELRNKPWLRGSDVEIGMMSGARVSTDGLALQPPGADAGGHAGMFPKLVGRGSTNTRGQAAAHGVRRTPNLGMTEDQRLEARMGAMVRGYASGSSIMTSNTLTGARPNYVGAVPMLPPGMLGDDARIRFADTAHERREHIKRRAKTDPKLARGMSPEREPLDEDGSGGDHMTRTGRFLRGRPSSPPPLFGGANAVERTANMTAWVTGPGRHDADVEHREKECDACGHDNALSDAFCRACNAPF